jgi:S-adenosylmethionine hydrolase
VVGTFIRLTKELNDLTEKARNDSENNLIKLLIAEKETEIELQRDLIWGVDRFSNIVLNCEHDYILEALASNIKGAVISFQSLKWTT